MTPQVVPQHVYYMRLAGMIAGLLDLTTLEAARAKLRSITATYPSEWEIHRSYAVAIWWLECTKHPGKFYIQPDHTIVFQAATERKEPDPEYTFQEKKVRRQERAIKHNMEKYVGS